MGCVNYGVYINDFKGLIFNLIFDFNIFIGWMIFLLDIEDVVYSYFGGWEYYDSGCYDEVWVYSLFNYIFLVFYVGNFFIFSGILDLFQDIFIQFFGWIKGQVWINGFNFGCYWLVWGFQLILFVFQYILMILVLNIVIVLELEWVFCSSDGLELCVVEFVDRLVIGLFQIYDYFFKFVE